MYGMGSSSHQSAGAGITDSESSHIKERRHEASASIRLVDMNGDVIWSTTQESAGGKFRGAMADVADKIAQNRNARQVFDADLAMRKTYDNFNAQLVNMPDEGTWPARGR